MKRYIGILVLVMLLAAATGCTTQQAKPAVTTTTVAPAEVPAEEKTPVPATTATKKVTTTPTAKKETTEAATVATTRPDMTPSTKVTVIHIRNNTFVPDQLTVLPGTGITWINDDWVTHVVKATGDAKGKFTSADIVNGAQFGYTFGAGTGTFEFEDPSYPEMKGAIIVKEGEALVGD